MDSVLNTNSDANAKINDSHMFLVSNLLTGNENYMQWKYSIQIVLGAKRKAGFIDGTTKKPESEGAELDDWIILIYCEVKLNLFEAQSLNILRFTFVLLSILWLNFI